MFRDGKRQTYAGGRIGTLLVLTSMIVLVAGLTLPPVSHAQAARAQPVQRAATVLPINANEVVSAHNAYRTAVGDPAFRWSSTVAQSAQNWALTMASTYHNCVHSSQSQRSGHGENCALGTAGHFTVKQLIDEVWGAEKQNYIVGCTFSMAESHNPCSKTGNWINIGHYTQIVWRNTVEVGCGFVSDGQKDYLICQYNPPGNIVGQKVY